MVENKDFKVRISKAEDVSLLVDNLRQDDVDELTAGGSTPLVSLMNGYLFSDECYSAFVNDQIIGMFGVCYNTNSIWFLGSDLSASVKREWIRTASYYIRHFLEIKPVLTNTVSTNNKVHIKWLKRMGAKFSVPYEYNNHLFQDFYLIKGD